MEEDSVAVHTDEGNVYFIDFKEKKRVLIKDVKDRPIGEVSMIGHKYSVEESVKQMGQIDDKACKHSKGKQIFFLPIMEKGSSNMIMSKGTGKIVGVYKRVA